MVNRRFPAQIFLGRSPLTDPNCTADLEEGYSWLTRNEANCAPLWDQYFRNFDRF